MFWGVEVLVLFIILVIIQMGAKVHLGYDTTLKSAFFDGM